MWLNKVVPPWRFGIFVLLILLDLTRRNVSGVTQIMSNHNGGVQTGKVKSGNGHLVVVLFGVQNKGSFEFAIITSGSLVGNQIVMLFAESVELTGHLDLLTPREQVIQRHSRHSAHLCVVIHTHQLLAQSQWQKTVFQTVDCQSSSSLVVPVL